MLLTSVAVVLCERHRLARMSCVRCVVRAWSHAATRQATALSGRAVVRSPYKRLRASLARACDVCSLPSANRMRRSLRIVRRSTCSQTRPTGSSSRTASSSKRGAAPYRTTLPHPPPRACTQVPSPPTLPFFAAHSNRRLVGRRSAESEPSHICSGTVTLGGRAADGVPQTRGSQARKHQGEDGAPRVAAAGRARQAVRVPRRGRGGEDVLGRPGAAARGYSRVLGVLGQFWVLGRLANVVRCHNRNGVWCAVPSRHKPSRTAPCDPLRPTSPTHARTCARARTHTRTH